MFEEEQELPLNDRIRTLLGTQTLAAKPLQVGRTPFPQGTPTPSPTITPGPQSRMRPSESILPPDAGILQATPAPEWRIPMAPQDFSTPAPAPVLNVKQSIPPSPKPLDKKAAPKAKISEKIATKKPAPKKPAASGATAKPAAAPSNGTNFFPEIAAKIGGVKSSTVVGGPVPPGGRKPGDYYLGVSMPELQSTETVKSGNEAIQAQAPAIMSDIESARRGGLDPQKQAQEQADLASMKATRMEDLIRQYGEETDRVKKNQLWDAIIRGGGRIAAGIASGVSGYNVAGAYSNMEPPAYDPETDLKIAEEKYRKGESTFADYIRELQRINTQKYTQAHTQTQLGVDPQVLRARELLGQGSPMREQTRGVDTRSTVVQANPQTAKEDTVRQNRGAEPPRSLNPEGKFMITFKDQIAQTLGNLNNADNVDNYIKSLSFTNAASAGWPPSAVRRLWDKVKLDNPKLTGKQVAAEVTGILLQTATPLAADAHPDDVMAYRARRAKMNQEFGSSLTLEPWQSGRVQTPDY